METRGIAGLRLQNIGKFETFGLELREGEIIEIQGDNDEGKSTIPLCIEAAIFGDLEDKTGPNHAAPDGEGTMTVEVNGYTITRVVTTTDKGPKTKSLEVVDEHGQRPYEGGAVQTFLSNLFPKGAFINPFTLMDKPKKDQIGAIVKALPLDLAYAQDRLNAIGQGKYDLLEIDSAEMCFDIITRMDKDFREDRLAIGRTKDAKEAAYRGAIMALPKDYDSETPPPVAPTAMADLYTRKEEITKANIRREELHRKLAANEQEIRRLQEQIAGLTNANETMTAELQRLGQARETADLDAKIADHRRLMEEYQTAIEVHGDRKRRRREADEFYAQWQTALAEHGDLDGRVKALSALPAELFKRAELPIPGMYIEGDTIMIPHPETGELRPAEEYGNAAMLDLYIALAMTLAPIPVILADGLEQCGPKRSQEIYDRIRAKGFQLIGTRVTPGEFRVVRINAEVGGEPTTVEVMPVTEADEFDDIPVIE
jgi:DNA repair exonuclease SbcCD ATPase subunit